MTADAQDRKTVRAGSPARARLVAGREELVMEFSEGLLVSAVGSYLSSSVCLSVRPSIHLSIQTNIHLSSYPSISAPLSLAWYGD